MKKLIVLVLLTVSIAFAQVSTLQNNKVAKTDSLKANEWNTLVKYVQGIESGDSTTVAVSVVGWTTTGEALVKLTNPSAVRFIRINADNTVTALSASDFRTAIGAGDMIAADFSDSLGLGTKTQAYSSNLSTLSSPGNWKVFYTNGSGAVQALDLGSDGTYLRSSGPTSAPTFSTPSGSGDVSKVGTPVDNQVGVWTGDGTIEGDADLTFDGDTLQAKVIKLGTGGMTNITSLENVENVESDTVVVNNYIKIPNGTNPTTDTAGEIAVDIDDHFIEFYSNVSRVIGALQCRTFTIVNPDSCPDEIVLFHVMADAYPHGITIKDIAISASSNMSDTHVIEEWSNRAGSTQSTIESITLSNTQYQEDDGTLSDSNIAADAFIVLDRDSSTDDVASMEVTITFWINAGD